MSPRIFRVILVYIYLYFFFVLKSSENDHIFNVEIDLYLVVLFYVAIFHEI